MLNGRTRTIVRQAAFLDTFCDVRGAGQVVGSSGPNGVVREGVDVENVMSVDNGALRISPLMVPGWERSGIAYGPYRRESGLAFGVLLLNGHHSSQTGHLMQSMPRRLYRWARGGAGDSLVRRGVQFLRHGDKRAFWAQLQRWALLNSRYAPETNNAIDENLSVGWFAVDAIKEPLTEGQSFVIHAAGPENGELWTSVGHRALPILLGMQNVPLYLTVVLRQMGAAYYAASLPAARLAAAYPDFRPVAIDTTNAEPVLYAGLSQSVLGQIGFRVDTRVRAAQVAQLGPSRQAWYGTAHAADALSDGGARLEFAEIGGRWEVNDRLHHSNGTGLNNVEQAVAVLKPDAPSGLIHIIVRGVEPLDGAGVVFRHHDDDNYWCLQICPDRYSLCLKQEGVWREVASAPHPDGDLSIDVALQIIDDGREIRVARDGGQVFDLVTDSFLGDCCGVGLCGARAWRWARNFEAHPRLVRFPELFGEQFAFNRPSVVRIAADDFTNGDGDLALRTTPLGNRQWRRDLGKGQIVLDRDQARVVASVDAPNPGRTAYTISWHDDTFADLEVEIVPPGTGRGEGHSGRSGLIFWQDSANYIVISNWLDDHYGGASLSSFYHLNGFEELYDAVWTNVGARIRWGVPYRLRVMFDGREFTAYIDEEPVLVRALTDIYPNFAWLSIKRVGIVANWEWGDDTGSIFRRFNAYGQTVENEHE